MMGIRELFLWNMLIALLSACAVVQAKTDETMLSPTEAAVYQWMMTHQSNEVANSLAVLRTITRDAEQSLLLISFHPKNWSVDYPALALATVQKEDQGWKVHQIDITEPSFSQDLLTFYSHHPEADPPFSVAYGFILNQQVQHVTLTWEDGYQEMVSASSGIYISIRTDEVAVQTLKALDARGNILVQQ